MFVPTYKLDTHWPIDDENLSGTRPRQPSLNHQGLQLIFVSGAIPRDLTGFPAFPLLAANISGGLRLAGRRPILELGSCPPPPRDYPFALIPIS